MSGPLVGRPDWRGAPVGVSVFDGHESVGRRAIQEDIDEETRDGLTSGDRAEIEKLRAEHTSLRGDVALLRSATSFFVGVLWSMT